MPTAACVIQSLFTCQSHSGSETDRKREIVRESDKLTETDLVIMTTMNEQYIHLNLHQLRPQLLNMHT